MADPHPVDVPVGRPDEQVSSGRPAPGPRGQARAGEASPPRPRRGARPLLLLPAGACLLLGLDAALLLAGVPAGGWSTLADLHGPLMVLGFLGSVISLERAVALRARWGYAAPLLLALGGLLLVSPAPAAVGWVALVNGTLVFVAVYAALFTRSGDAVVLSEGVGAAAALTAAALWPRLGAAGILPWLVVFIVLTIAAERVELAAIAMPPTARRTLLLFTGALVGAATLAMLHAQAGGVALGVVLLALLAWLAQHDIARRTVRTTGLTRFSAAGILAGYVWLAIAAVLLVRHGVVRQGEAYDALLHATFLGFAMSMVFAHAPIIVPAVIARPLPYHPAMWLPPALLHAGLLVRLGLGDALGLRGPWQVGAVLNVLAILAFLVVTVWRVATAKKPRSAGNEGSR